MSMVRQILKEKGDAVWSTTPQSMLSDVIGKMAEKQIGAILVLDGNKIAGIFSERDFIEYSAKKEKVETDIPISDIMTKKVLFVSPSESVTECMAIMTARRIRHLPVIDNDKLVGIISIGDVVKKIIEEQKFSLEQLEKYVSGEIL